MFNLLHIGRLSLNTSALVQVHFVSGDELRTNLPNEFSSVVRRSMFKLTLDLLAKYARQNAALNEFTFPKQSTLPSFHTHLA